MPHPFASGGPPTDLSLTRWLIVGVGVVALGALLLPGYLLHRLGLRRGA